MNYARVAPTLDASPAGRDPGRLGPRRLTPARRPVVWPARPAPSARRSQPARTATGTLAGVKSIVEPLDDNRVKLTIEVPEAEMEAAVDDAFKRLARQIRMPGFRPGRAPRKLLEAQLGSGAGRSEALRASVPEYYAQAVIDHDVDVISSPEIEIIDGQESGPVSFGAVVEVRPSVSISGYEGLQIEIPSPVVDDAETQGEIDRFLGAFAELSPVARPAADGDHVTIDINGSVGGEAIAGLTASDYDYVVGTGAVVAEIDQNLRGAAVGDIVEFEADHPDPDEDRPLRFRVLVKEVSQTVLPDLDDELVAAHTEYATASELRADIESRQSAMKILRCHMARDQALTVALAEMVAEEPPAAMIDREVEARLVDLDEEFRRRGSDISSAGRPVEEIAEELRVPAARAVKFDLALRAVASAEGLEPSDADVDADIERAATRPDANGATPDELRAKLVETGQLSSLRAALAKSAARRWLLDRAVLVGPDGEAIAPEALELPEGDDEADDPEAPESDAGEAADTEQEDS